jgi:hypothetical protein
MGGAAPDLDAWLASFLAALGHKRRRGWAPLHLRGRLGPSERKSLQPMAACLGLSGFGLVDSRGCRNTMSEGGAMAGR